MSTIRVVSLVPSASETLVALGVTPVACTRFCELAGVPVVGGTKNVDVEAVAALEPDLVIVNDEENRIEDADALEARGLALHSMSPRSVADVGPAVGALAAALGVDTPAPFALWQSWIECTQRPARLSAFVPIWRRPWMSLAADTYGSSLLAHVGIRNVFGSASVRYPEVTLPDVADLAPDVVLLPSEPYVFADRHTVEVRDAIAHSRPMFVDGRDLFWWGIRTPVAAGRLQQIS